MTTSDPIYITTPIYYVNDVPHIGHSYTTVISDILARYFRLIGHPVFFLTGTDEHGQKIEKAAENKDLKPKELVDSVVKRFKAVWETLNISNDRFIRTTDAEHEAVVKAFFKTVYEKKYIYLGEYEGLYCHHCESYYTETQVEDNKCPECKRELTILKEEALFFRLSEFEDRILAYIEENPDFVLPVSRKNEVLSFVKSGLNDLCISRTTSQWGISVPDVGLDLKENHVIYVWFDALLNYLSGIGYQQETGKYKEFWPAHVHMIGKDILKFHAVIWPAMLMAADLPIPKHVFGHGFIYQGGEKMSKSKGNVIDPLEIVAEYGVDAFRYYISREVVLGLDGTYSDENMLGRYNSDLANDYGNLINRTLNMIGKYFDFKLGNSDEALLSQSELELKELTTALPQKAEGLMKDFKLSGALEEIFVVIRRANKFIEECAPWTLNKEGNTAKLMTVMIHLLEAIRVTTYLLSPFMPEATTKALLQLNISDDSVERPDLGWGYFQPEAIVNKPEPIFPRK